MRESEKRKQHRKGRGGEKEGENIKGKEVSRNKTENEEKDDSKRGRTT